MSAQLALDLDVESFSKQEKVLVKLLRNHRTIDVDIRRNERWAKGDGILIEPSVTASLGDEDDLEVLIELRMADLDERQQLIVDTYRKWCATDKWLFAAKHRVVRELGSAVADNKDDDETLQAFYTMLSEKLGEERVELTDTERVAIRRERFISKARARLEFLRERKAIVQAALDDLRDTQEYDYTLVYNRYVLDKSPEEVCGILSPVHPLEMETYFKHRKRAMLNFAKMLPVQFIS